MIIFAYRCEVGHTFDRFLKRATPENKYTRCAYDDCNARAKRLISPVRTTFKFADNRQLRELQKQASTRYFDEKDTGLGVTDND